MNLLLSETVQYSLSRVVVGLVIKYALLANRAILYDPGVLITMTDAHPVQPRVYRAEPYLLKSPRAGTRRELV